MNPAASYIRAAVLAGMLIVACTPSQADTIPGVGRYVSNALVIQVVQVPTVDATSPSGSENGQRVRVVEVLKGISTASYLTLPKDSLQPGAMGLVLHSFVSGRSYPPPPKIFVWPLDSAGLLDTHGVPREGTGWRPTPADLRVSLDFLKSQITQSTPEEVGLHRDALAYLLAEDAEREKAGWSPFLKVALAIRGLGRDVPTLAPLLESSDPEIRRKAAARLHECTGVMIPEPADDSAASLHAWSQAWEKLPPPKRDVSKRWPEIPASQKLPDLAYPEPLLQALEQQDAEAFCRSFALWLESGVTRDHLMERSRELSYEQGAKSNVLSIFGSAYLPPAPRVRADALWNAAIPVRERMMVIAALTTFYHKDDIAREKQEATEFLNSPKADAHLLRKAAFWEMRDDGDSTLGNLAVCKLAAMDEDEDIQAFLLSLFFRSYHGPMLDIARAAIQKDRKVFVEGLLAHLQTHRDDTAGWIGRLFCQEQKTIAVPILIEWLEDPNPEVRRVAALDLSWLPHRDAVTALLEAIPEEKVPAVKDQFLITLAQQRDERALKVLLSEASQPHESYVTGEILRGLGRLRDPAALPVMASLAVKAQSDLVTTPSNSGSESILRAAIISFGYISKWPGCREPDAFGSSSGMSQPEIDTGFQRIEAWRASQK